MLAALTKSQLLRIDKDEADALSRGITGVARHYDVGGMSQKTLDWFNLFQTLSIVYGPRIFVAQQQAKERKAQNQRRAQVETPTPEPENQGNGFDPSFFQPGPVE